jgi:hypothetical protein
VDKGADGEAWSKRRIHLGATPRGDLWYVSREPGKRFLFLLTSLAFLAFHSLCLSPPLPLLGRGEGERGIWVEGGWARLRSAKAHLVTLWSFLSVCLAFFPLFLSLSFKGSHQTRCPKGTGCS